jgi:hypothetical protein
MSGKCLAHCFLLDLTSLIFDDYHEMFILPELAVTINSRNKWLLLRQKWLSDR